MPRAVPVDRGVALMTAEAAGQAGGAPVDRDGDRAALSKRLKGVAVPRTAKAGLTVTAASARAPADAAANNSRRGADSGWADDALVMVKRLRTIQSIFLEF